jgi:protein arginine N-methyltransferase 5
MNSPKIEASLFERDVDEEEVDDTWHWWNNFRITANFEKKLSLALELTADLPDAVDIDRWLGEPIKCLVVPTHLFMTNKKGFPVLPKSHQVAIRQFLRQKTQILITGAQRHQHYKHYQQYIEHLWQVRGNNNHLLSFSSLYCVFL